VELAGSAAIVTGGASGIGLATVELLRAAGAHVAVLDVQQGSGPAELYIRCDISIEEEVVDGVRQVHDAFGGLDVAVRAQNGTGCSASTCAGRSSVCVR